MLKITSLKTYFDEIEETNGDDEYRAWLSRVFDAKVILAKFVAARRGGGEATEYVGFLKGSFNFSFRYRFSDGGPDAIIRFPKPGHTATALMDEKVANEAQVMNYLSQNTTIPLPRILSWGLTAESPQQLGPFIIMDYIEGTLLSNVLKQSTKSDDELPLPENSPSSSDSCCNHLDSVTWTAGGQRIYSIPHKSGPCPAMHACAHSSSYLQ
ncbi:hypothetical protein FPOAC2_07613 [Fusarium poae]|jgi:serine/threonine protein kinase|uniref:Aminoglycoside phosphotransferase domain-containing protein n=1 Tax=Fusarium poae TaxID=36050 RepID=A0A1B8AIL8_FUSPO|nr:hypothetical protein FPOAC1_007704 [Fusarium poae]KAG8668325.1 hypothetical protein FPOAC1_007704 [Fusarium poae]OBS20419.1 hypothetical protein FPOA_06789 [Fusarium poae]